MFASIPKYQSGYILYICKPHISITNHISTYQISVAYRINVSLIDQLANHTDTYQISVAYQINVLAIT